MITSFFLASDGAANCAELALWRAVIAQALDDALLGNLHLLGGAETQLPSRIDQYAMATRLGEMTRARNWFERYSPDFQKVCEFAGVVPERVQRAAVSAIAEFDRSHDWRQARGGMWG